MSNIIQQNISRMFEISNILDTHYTVVELEELIVQFGKSLSIGACAIIHGNIYDELVSSQNRKMMNKIKPLALNTSCRGFVNCVYPLVLIAMTGIPDELLIIDEGQYFSDFKRNLYDYVVHSDVITLFSL